MAPIVADLFFGGLGAVVETAPLALESEETKLAAAGWLGSLMYSDPIGRVRNESA